MRLMVQEALRDWPKRYAKISALMARMQSEIAPQATHKRNSQDAASGVGEA